MSQVAHVRLFSTMLAEGVSSHCTQGGGEAGGVDGGSGGELGDGGGGEGDGGLGDGGGGEGDGGGGLGDGGGGLGDGGLGDGGGGGLGVLIFLYTHALPPLCAVTFEQYRQLVLSQFQSWIATQSAIMAHRNSASALVPNHSSAALTGMTPALL